MDKHGERCNRKVWNAIKTMGISGKEGEEVYEEEIRGIELVDQEGKRLSEGKN